MTGVQTCALPIFYSPLDHWTGESRGITSNVSIAQSVTEFPEPGSVRNLIIICCYILELVSTETYVVFENMRGIECKKGSQGEAGSKRSEVATKNKRKNQSMRGAVYSDGEVVLSALEFFYEQELNTHR